MRALVLLFIVVTFVIMRVCHNPAAPSIDLGNCKCCLICAALLVKESLVQAF